MICTDTSKTYRTRSGHRVVLHEVVPRNSCGALVTFPVKGTIVLSEKPRRTRFNIWTIDGRAEAVGESKFDIVEVEK